MAGFINWDNFPPIKGHPDDEVVKKKTDKEIIKDAMDTIERLARNDLDSYPSLNEAWNSFKVIYKLTEDTDE